MEIADLLKDPKFSISRTLVAKTRSNQILTTVLGICAVYTDIRIAMGIDYEDYFTPKTKTLTKGAQENIKKAVGLVHEAFKGHLDIIKIEKAINHMVDKKWLWLLDAMIVIPDHDQIKDYKSFDYWINRYIRHVTKSLTN